MKTICGILSRQSEVGSGVGETGDDYVNPHHKLCNHLSSDISTHHIILHLPTYFISLWSAFSLARKWVILLDRVSRQKLWSERNGFLYLWLSCSHFSAYSPTLIIMIYFLPDVRERELIREVEQQPVVSVVNNPCCVVSANFLPTHYFRPLILSRFLPDEKALWSWEKRLGWWVAHFPFW